MSSKTQYWIRSTGGDYALVEGVEERDLWTRVRGWAEASEPSPADQVHVRWTKDDGVGPGRFTYAALAAGLGDIGWQPGPPPPPVDLTKDPQLFDQPVVEPEKQSAPASGTTSKEK